MTKTQTDIAILDFSKPFDKVPHDKLLHKLDNYGVRGRTHSWIKSFLCDRLMRVVVDGETSSEVHVESGVPQGTVLGPLLFLTFINDLPDSVSILSKIRLFADDCLLYRQIKSREDHTALQDDLNRLEKWSLDWGMSFNASKCYILSVRKRSSHFYVLNDTVLKDVKTNPYLGVTLSDDLKWTTHIGKITSKASSVLGFLRRNLRFCPPQVRKSAYLALIRSTLEYASTIWDPNQQGLIDKLERLQRKSARFITGDYKTRTPGSMTSMLRELGLPSLQARRKELRLTLLFKIAGGLVPAIPPEDYLIPVQNKRRIKAKTFDNCVTQNFVTSAQRLHDRCFVVPQAKSDIFRGSFFVKTIQDWNQLDSQTINSPSVDSFKARLQL